MKILQVIPDLNLAGAQTMCENLVLEQKKDNTVEIICLYNNDTPIVKRLKKQKIKIHFLNKKRGIDLSLIRKIHNIIDTFEPDVIHTHRYVLEYVIPAVKKSKNTNVKIIHTVHNIASKEVPWYLQILQKKWFKAKKIIPIAISEEIKKSIIDLYNIKESEIPLIYNGIDLDRCIQKDNYEFNNTILHIGRFNPQKNHYELIRIFEKCICSNKKLALILVGDGDLKEEIEKIIIEKNLQKNVFFKGLVAEPYEILNTSDIFILPSKWEGMPMTLIEAMATGLPCVAYPVGGIKDMIIDGVNGFIPKDEFEFYDCIIKLSNDEKLRETIGKNAIESSKKYSVKEMNKKYINIYKKGE